MSRLGEADFHKIVLKHDRVYGFDAVLGAMLISDDGGRKFVERFTPPGLVIDFEVDPEDPDHLLAATDKRLVRSTDGGKRWRPIDTGEGIRLAWPAPGALYRAQRDGTVERSRDGGGSVGARRPGPGRAVQVQGARAGARSTSRSATARSSAPRTAASTWTTAFRP